MHCCYLGVDLGTSNLSCVILDVDSGELLAKFSIPNDADIKFLPQGRFEQSPTRIIELSIKLINQAAEFAKSAAIQLKGIGITGQMHGVVIVDQELKPQTNLITWQDQRCLELIPDKSCNYIEYIIEAAGGREYFSPHGCLPATGFLGPTIFWLKVNNLLPHIAAKALFIHDYLAAILTGGKLQATDPSDAQSSGFFNIKASRWAYELISKLGLPAELFPEVLESGCLLGEITKGVAKKIGLTDALIGVPVFCAIGDNQASIIGSIRDPDSSLLLNLGTGGQISVIIKEFRSALPELDSRYLPRDRYALVGASLFGGRAYKWLEEVFKQIGYTFWQIPFEGQNLLDKMNELARAVSAGADGLRCTTFFAGTRADPNKRASFTGISEHNFTPAHMARATLEAMVEELYDFYKIIKKVAPQIDMRYIVGSGGSIRHNPLLREIIQQIFNLPVKLPKHQEEAAYGTALIAATGDGKFKTIEEASKVIQYM